MRAIAAHSPRMVGELLADGSSLLAAFATTGNTEGVSRLLDLGVAVASRNEGNGY